MRDLLSKGRRNWLNGIVINPKEVGWVCLKQPFPQLWPLTLLQTWQFVYLYLTVPNSWASPGMICFYYASINKRHIPCFIVMKGRPVTTLNEPAFQRQTWHICISFFPCFFFLDLEGAGERNPYD